MGQVAITTVASGSGVSVEFILNLFGVLVALVAIIIFLGSKGQEGSRVGAGLKLIVWGIIFNTFSLVWDIVFMFTKGAPAYIEDAHPLFVIIGRVFFIKAAQKFSTINTHAS